MIHLDTSVLVAAFGRPSDVFDRLRAFVDRGERLGVSTIVLYEWWRGPRDSQDLADQDVLLPSAAAFPFGAREAEIAAGIYRSLRRPRQREVDIAIAACALAHDAALWTLNPRDFQDIPGLLLVGK